MPSAQKLTPNLWFDSHAEEAAQFYVSVFPESEILSVSRYGEAGFEIQAEVDHYWDALTEGGDPEAQQCGWLKDKFGVSWQVVPEALARLMGDPDPAVAERVMTAFLPMKKLIVADLENAARG